MNAVQDRHLGATHSHDFLQIWYVVSGSYFHTINGVTVKQLPGSGVLVFPYVPHSINTLESKLSQTLVVQISIKKHGLEAFGIPFQAISCKSVSFRSRQLPAAVAFQGDQKATADSLCLELLTEYRKNQNMNVYKLLMLTASFLELFAEHSAQTISSRMLQSAQDRSACIEAALACMHCNSSNPLTLDEISSVAMMSRRSFTSGFLAVTGQSCYDYLRQLRMKRAVDLLRKTTKSIGEIAEECGFYDSSHFHKASLELYGTPPLTLRRELSQWTRECGDRLYRRTIRESAWAMTFPEEAKERHRCAMSFY